MLMWGLIAIILNLDYGILYVVIEKMSMRENLVDVLLSNFNLVELGEIVF